MEQTSVFSASPYQQKYFDWLASGVGNCVLIAVAGSGKSTTVLQSLRFVPATCTVILLAFNTNIADELTAKIQKLFPGSKHRASTFHSLGFGAVRKALRACKVEKNKLAKICDAFLPNEKKQYASVICKLVSLARGIGIGCLVPDIESEWHGLIAHHDIECDFESDDATMVELARQLLRRSNETAKNTGMVDFDDMLYLPVLWKLPVFKHDFVFIDEAQDTSPIRRALARMALKHTGRLTAVGDPAQSIYGFTGASHDAIEQIKLEFDATELPLTVSYRCPKAVAEYVRPMVPYFEAFENAKEGSVEHLSQHDAQSKLTAKDAILCRNVAPLVSYAFGLIADGIGCAVLGRDIGAGLVSMVKKTRAKDIDSLLDKLAVFEQKETDKFLAQGKEDRASGVTDKVTCIRVIIARLDANNRTIDSLVSEIESLFKDDSRGLLTLSTVHKAKGREWPTVAILEPNRMPSPWARQEWQKQQERNIQYVAFTRAQERLIFMSK